MIKIRAINKYDPREIIDGILDGKKIYRINFAGEIIINMEDRQLDQILNDEKKYPGKYGYFELIKDETTEVDGALASAEADGYIFNPPSGKLLKVATEIYGIEPAGMTTRQILMEIAQAEVK